jgi:MFS family permease
LILIVNTAVASLAIFALRGIYFALLEEGGTPLALTGTVTGIVSVIGYTPDIFMPMVGGVFLDRYPGGSGYRYFFLFIAFLCLLGLLAAFFILKKFVRKSASETNEPSPVK